jgi:hypothetical protein
MRGAKRRSNLKTEIATPAFGGLAMTKTRIPRLASLGTPFSKREIFLFSPFFETGIGFAEGGICHLQGKPRNDRKGFVAYAPII